MPIDEHWLPGVGASKQFYYDVTFFSSDQIVVGDDFNTIAEMYFRINTDTIIHQRSSYNLVSWLCDIGGIELLMS